MRSMCLGEQTEIMSGSQAIGNPSFIFASDTRPHWRDSRKVVVEDTELHPDSCHWTHSGFTETNHVLLEAERCNAQEGADGPVRGGGGRYEEGGSSLEESNPGASSRLSGRGSQRRRTCKSLPAIAI